ncbi:MAG: hypothetical protein AABX84_02605, partial [Nanoarchaeota archaeon]
ESNFAFMKSIAIVFLVLLVIIFTLDVKNNYMGQILLHKGDLLARNEVLKREYKKSGVDVEKLDKDFRNIRTDYFKGEIKLLH